MQIRQLIARVLPAALLPVICVMTPVGVQARVEVAPVPKAVYYKYHNDDFTVQVRPVGEREWIDLYEYKLKVDMDTNSDASMVTFDFDGSVDVSVRKNNGHFRTVDIRPFARGIRHKVEGDRVVFRLDRPQNLSIEFDGDRLHNLHLFACPLQRDVPVEGTPGVRYFGLGVHEPDDAETKTFRISSGSTVYLAPGAILRGSLNCDSTDNVRVCGRGMIWGAPNGISAGWATRLRVEDIVVVNPRYNTFTAGQATDISVSGLKSFSHQGWGDGLDFYCCRGVRVDGVFLRNSDDCVAIYGHRWNFYGDTDDILVSNSVLWADIAHPINIGTHGDTSTEGETLSRIRFENIDVLEHDEDDRDYQGVMTVNAGDHNLVRDVTFDNIRVEHIQEGQLFHLRVMDLPRYCTGPGRGIENVTFSRISYDGQGENPSVITGYDGGRMVRGVTFRQIRIRGRRVRRIKQLPLYVGPHVDEISVH
ncbi:MAG: glycosyl hydrolase family 28 protein [Clostridium sp.]|nr:glycosyl hydrolase family 28 protein [Clostridium sp.]